VRPRTCTDERDRVRESERVRERCSPESCEAAPEGTRAGETVGTLHADNAHFAGNETVGLGLAAPPVAAPQGSMWRQVSSAPRVP